MHMPQFPNSFWYSDIEFPAYPSLNEDIAADVTIIGAGISGITAAYLLSQEGVRVALIEAGKVLNGTTGHTTAKVTAQHGIIYDELIAHFGLEGAKQYYQANDQARAFIKNNIQSLGIECDFQEHDAYVYTNSENERQKLEKEAKAYQKIGIQGGLTTGMPLDLPMIEAVKMEKQAQFHPVSYLLELLKKIEENGGQIFEQTTALDIESGTKPKVTTRGKHTITSNNVIIASHYPFYEGFGFYFARMYQERSYIVAIPAAKPYPGGMYITSESPTRSVRSTRSENGELLLIGGEGHKTGHGINTMKHYEALAEFSKTHFNTETISYRWSAEDVYTLEKVPYIGRITNGQDNIFVATGYRKWGMTNGTAAGLILKDLIVKGSHPFEELFSPSRFKMDPSVQSLVSHNADVAKEFVKGKLEPVQKQPEDVEKGEGCHVKMNGQKACAYRDHDGNLHIVDATCTHLGCEVEWNEGETTWDCPCHGSRYSIDGEVVNGPAIKPLKKLSAPS